MMDKKEWLKKTAKLALTGAILTTMMVSPAFAAEDSGSVSEGVTSTATANQVKKITLQEAMDQALENNSTVITAANAWEKAKVEKEQAESQAEKMWKALGKPSNNQLDQDQYAAIVLAPQLKGMAVEMAEYSNDLAIAATKLQVINQYFTIASCGKTENSLLDAYEKAQRQYNTVKSKYNVGMASKLEVTTAQLEIDSAKIALENARNNTTQSKRALCVTMGLDANAQISPSTALTYEKLNISDKDQAVQELVEKNPQVKIDKVNYEMAKVQYDYDISINSDYTYNGQIAQKTFDSAKVQYETTLRETEANAYKTIENLLLAEKQYNMALESKELYQEVYRLAELRYENGLATQNDVLDAAADLTNADSQIIAALLQFNVAKTAMDQGIISE